MRLFFIINSQVIKVFKQKLSPLIAQLPHRNNLLSFCKSNEKLPSLAFTTVIAN